jgi:type IV pilus assembly protein PilC
MTDNLQKYQWTGISQQGKRLKGAIESTDIKLAEQELRKKDIVVITITQTSQHSFLLFRKKTKAKDIIIFTRFLSTMLASGLPIIQALELISHDQENEAMKSIVLSLKSSISSGTTLADALSKYPDSFNYLYCNLIRTGEKSGTLDKVLKQLSKYLERIEFLKRKIRNALIYPIAVMVIAFGVSLILLLFVIPEFQKIFTNAGIQLPLVTRYVISLSDFLRHYWWLLIAVIMLLIWGYKSTIKKNEQFAYFIDKLKLRIFIIGPIIQKSIIARFTSTLAITLNSGLPIVDSMKSMINIMGNRVFANGIKKISEELTSGHQLSSAMAETKIFPVMTMQMIAVGEAAGELPTMLNSVADYYQEEIDDIANNLSTLLEPVIIVVLGIIIGTFVVAMYLPIFKLGSTIK